MAPKGIREPELLTPIEEPAELLGAGKREELLQGIRALMAVDDARYESLCYSLLYTFARYCQQLPETANRFFALPGGLLDHALHRTEAALNLFRTAVVQEGGSLTDIQMLWQYALFSAAMLKGIGKLKLHYRISMHDAAGVPLQVWNPLLDAPDAVGSHYGYTWEKEADPLLMGHMNLLMARALMPASGFAWIASDDTVLAVWLALLADDPVGSGTLGALLDRADAIALTRYYQDLLARTTAGMGGRFARVSTFVDNVPKSLLSREQETGIVFMQWLEKGLAEGTLQLNKPPVMMVLAGMLLCSDAFKLFVREHPEYKNWLAVQKGFLSLGLHRTGAGDAHETRFEQANTSQVHTGIVFEKYAMVLPESVKVHDLYTGQESRSSALDVVYATEHGSQLHTQQAHAAPGGIQQLGADGAWKAPLKAADFLRRPVSSRSG